MGNCKGVHRIGRGKGTASWGISMVANQGEDGNELGRNERGSEGPSPSISNKNNNNGNEEVSSGQKPGRVAVPTYEDVFEVLDARKRRTDDVSERDCEAHQ